ncbi:hypothetical protein [Methylibium rhizosphaerae]|uniref:hypothetical protein n=1 Tax=Methylibium rhizosphaerae TaxID=2570323 RepID=UPI001129B299|nr:hypothetical protein [Methylibium rhizosphaerae]
MGKKSWLMVMTVAGAMSSAGAWAADAGVASWRPRLQATEISDGWLSAARLQGRLGLATSTRLGRLDSSPASAEDGSRIESVSLMGDYYFSIRRGLRATGGVVLGSRPTFWAAQPSFGLHGATTALAAERRSFTLGGGDIHGDSGPTTAIPYLGVGYTGTASAARSADTLRAGSWGFTADVGLMAQNSRQGLRLGARPQQSFDDFLRDLKLAPMVQLGVSYSF